jgi:hypothetical protein
VLHIFIENKLPSPEIREITAELDSAKQNVIQKVLGMQMYEQLYQAGLEEKDAKFIAPIVNSNFSDGLKR